VFRYNCGTTYTARRGNAMTKIGQQMTIIDLGFAILHLMQNRAGAWQ
jgi:hypothetical protein